MESHSVTTDADVNLSSLPCGQTNIDEWNTLKDKNDNLELETAASESAEKACRICFNLIDTEPYLTFNYFTPGYLENLITMCLPKVNLLLTKDPVVCQKCFTKLEEFHSFSNECMKIESELLNYCSINQISSPVDICDFLKHSLKDTKDFVTVKQEEYNENERSTTDEDDIELNSVSNIRVDVKSENENSDQLENRDSTSKKIKITVTRVRKTRAKKLKVRVGRKPFSSDMIETQVKCETCEQKFTSKWALDRHTPIHNTDKANYTCESCDLKFKYKHSYNKHLNAHLTGAPISKPFACECGKFFNRKSKLKKHQEIHVKKEKPFACKSCGKRFIEEKVIIDNFLELLIQ